MYSTYKSVLEIGRLQLHILYCRFLEVEYVYTLSSKRVSSTPATRLLSDEVMIDSHKVHTAHVHSI